LFNWLARRDAAIVSEQAGTTRDAIEVTLDIDGYRTTLIDTAGLRDTVDDIEKEGIRRALSHASDADIIVALFDATQLPSLESETCDALTEDALIVINKCDQYHGELPEKIMGRDIIALSVKETYGLETMMTQLHQQVTKRMSTAESPVFTRERHRENLLKTQEHIKRFQDVMQDEGPIELATEDIRMAAQALGRITGKIEVDELLGAIFSRFCIGK
jgi:tRNA modification GTPase